MFKATKRDSNFSAQWRVDFEKITVINGEIVKIHVVGFGATRQKAIEDCLMATILRTKDAMRGKDSSSDAVKGA